MGSVESSGIGGFKENIIRNAKGVELKIMNKKYYTIFLGDKLWENVIDDMNTTEEWSKGGMLWEKKKLALACIKNLKKYDFETKEKKFRVVEFSLRYIKIPKGFFKKL